METLIIGLMATFLLALFLGFCRAVWDNPMLGAIVFASLALVAFVGLIVRWISG